MTLADRFHWTPAQVDEQPADYVDELIQYISARNEFEKDEAAKTK